MNLKMKVIKGKVNWYVIKNLSIKSIRLYLFFHDDNPIAVIKIVAIKVKEEPMIKSILL